MAKVIILCGLSGSGKSTYATTKYPNADILSVDHYLDYSEQGVTHNNDALKVAHGKCLAEFARRLDRYYNLPGETFVIDNANTTVLGIAPYASLAFAYECDLDIIIFKCDPYFAHSRNIHNVPLEDVLEQKERLDLLPERWSSWWPEPRFVEVEK